MGTLIHKQLDNGWAPSVCADCGDSGVPTFIKGEIQHDCPACMITNDDYAEMLKPLPPKQGRNEPCACGSGKKFKKCCLNKSDG